MMNVLLQSRMNLFSKPGGDTTQMVQLKNALNAKGLNARISTQLKTDLEPYDIVHLFNVTRVHETYLQMLRARRCRKHVICTPIFHDLEEYNRRGRYGFGEAVFRLAGTDSRLEHARSLFNALRDRRQWGPALKQIQTGYRVQQETVLLESDRVIFGSPSEKDTVFSRFPGLRDSLRYEVVRIGIGQRSGDFNSGEFVRSHGLKDFVLCVARIEDLKNQLSLIISMQGLGIPLVLIGSLNPVHRAYCKRVLEEIRGRQAVHYLGHLEGRMLHSAFAAAKVHVLPSWFETTGMVSLEAGLAGCNVVSTDRGYAKDYLSDFAWYCDPSDISSIRDAVQSACRSPVRRGLSEHIERNLSFNRMVGRLIEIYQETLCEERRA